MVGYPFPPLTKCAFSCEEEDRFAMIRHFPFEQSTCSESTKIVPYKTLTWSSPGRTWGEEGGVRWLPLRSLRISDTSMPFSSLRMVEQELSVAEGEWQHVKPSRGLVTPVII